MRWPRDLMILWNLLNGQFGGWIFCAAGILAAVLLHRRDPKARLWPALAAALLWLTCEVAGNNIQSYAIELFALFIGFFAIGYAAGWLVMDVVYLVKKQGEKVTGQ